MKSLMNTLATGVVIFLVIGFIYGCYYIGKTVSYSFFYEGMVQDSIRELVKGGCLK